MTKLKKGDLVIWRVRTSGAHRGIVLEESVFGGSYRVRWLTGSGGVGEHYRTDLIKIEVESGQTQKR